MKKLGFGLMRLPMNGDVVDIEKTKKMVDRFLEEGFTYFDTAFGYISKQSEAAIREALTSRYPRESYTLADKLSSFYIEKEEEIIPMFNKQLENCGVEYFDYYLHHSLNVAHYEKHIAMGMFDKVRKFKEEGKVKSIGISFHDNAEVLDKILTEQPDIEFVQIQFNYLDYDNPSVQSKLCYEVCRKHKKPIVIMEPVKGGKLANLPKEASEIFASIDNATDASYALRYAAGFPGVIMVLSGMSNLEQLEDNMAFMKDFQPLNDEELKAVEKVRQILKAQNAIPCTACEYCLDGCPMEIPIPSVLASLNAFNVDKDWNAKMYYNTATSVAGSASDCIECGVCESVCPQKIEIISHLKEASEAFE